MQSTENLSVMSLRISLFLAGIVLLHTIGRLAYSSPITQSTLNILLIVFCGGIGLGVIFLSAIGKPRPYFRYAILAVCILEILIGAFIWGQNTRTNKNGFGSQRSGFAYLDIGIVNEFAVELMQQGINPYTWDFSGTYDLLRTAQTASTAQLNGSYGDRYAYPPLSLYLALPFNAMGLPGTFLISVIGYMALFVALFVAAPPILKPLVLIPLASTDMFEWLVYGVTIDIIWTLFIVLMILTWKKQTWRAVFYGLAIATKQPPWLLAPFLLVHILYESDSLQDAIVRLLRFGLISGGILLATNAPFMVLNFDSWIQGVLQPLIDNMVYFSQTGLSSLTQYGYVFLPKTFYLVSMLSVMLLSVVVYAWHYRTLKNAIWIMPGIFMWFSYRALSSYWQYWAITAIAVVILLFRMDESKVSEKTVPRRSILPSLSASLALFGVLFGLGLIVSYKPAVTIEPLGFYEVNGRFRVNQLTVEVYNGSKQTLTPRFFIRLNGQTALPWYILDGEEQLQSDERDIYTIRVDRDDRSFVPYQVVQLEVKDANENYRLNNLIRIEPDKSYLFPDTVANPTFRYWSDDSPIYWVWQNQAPDTQKSYTDEGLLLRFDLPDTRIQRATLRSRIIFPRHTLTFRIPPKQDIDASLVHGVEFNDGRNKLIFVFGEEASSYQSRDGTQVIIYPVLSDDWTTHEINLLEVYQELGWELPSFQRAAYRGIYDLDLRFVDISVFVAARGEADNVVETFITSLVPDNQPPLTEILIEENLTDVGDYYLRLANWHIDYRNYDHALNAYREALAIEPENDNIQRQIDELCAYVREVEIDICDE